LQEFTNRELCWSLASLHQGIDAIYNIDTTQIEQDMASEFSIEFIRLRGKGEKFLPYLSEPAFFIDE